MLNELELRGLRQQTLIIVTAKHGQAPIDPALRHIVADSIIPTQVDAVAPGLVAQIAGDDIALLWLADQTKTALAVDALNNGKSQSFARIIGWTGNGLATVFRDPRTDSRTPDIMVAPEPGVIYASPTASKLEEHGGVNNDDNRVPILLSNPQIPQKAIEDAVTTQQVAPTILLALGLDWHALQAVGIEGTQPLPGQ
jgi:arylsulfatase A-like enzyme